MSAFEDNQKLLYGIDKISEKMAKYFYEYDHEGNKETLGANGDYYLGPDAAEFICWYLKTNWKKKIKENDMLRAFCAWFLFCLHEQRAQNFAIDVKIQSEGVGLTEHLSALTSQLDEWMEKDWSEMTSRDKIFRKKREWEESEEKE